MNKRTLLMVVSIVASLALAATGTLAYLTDTDSDVNVMTLGNVDIEQLEMKRDEDVANDATLVDGDLLTFEDGIKLYPAYPAAGDSAYAVDADPIVWGPYVTEEGASNPLFDDASLTGAVDKMIFVENTGASEAYVRTFIAYEMPEGFDASKLVLVRNENTDDVEWNSYGTIIVDGTQYAVMSATYKQPLAAGAVSVPSLLQVALHHTATNADMEMLGETYEILTLSQAVQTENMPEDPTEALNAAFNNGEAVDSDALLQWFSAMEGLPVATAATAEELAAALAEGGTVVLTDDIELDADDTITVPAGKSTTLSLGGNTITTESDETGANVNMFDVRGELTVTGGTLELTHTGTNMGWNNSTQLFNVTDGGVLNLKGVTAINNGGSDMAFVVHLNNWGEVTLNVEDSTLKATYCPVRVFNSGHDMNNVTITGSELISEGNRCFWVHNYIGDLNAAKHPDEAIKGRLNFDIFGNDNTYTNNGTMPVIRYGFGTTIYFTADGVQVDKDGNPV